jgi:hypothetical protein
MKVLSLNLKPLIILVVRMCFVAFSNVPSSEMLALEDLFEATGGYESWSWKKNEDYFGGLWNFTRNDAEDTYVHNPCSVGEEDNMTWQGIGKNGRLSPFLLI